jgi:Xaa-Pro aminopeptidase
MSTAPTTPDSAVAPLINVRRARDLLLSEGLDGVVTATLENTFYFSGVWNFAHELFPYNAESYVVVSADDVSAGTIVTSLGEADLALTANPTLRNRRAWGSFFRVAPEGVELDADEARISALEPAGSAIDALVAALDEQGLRGGAVGIDERGANRGLVDSLRERLPDTTFVPASDLLRRIRMVKTPAEQQRLIQTLRITEAAFEATIAAAYVGVTERELRRVFETAIVASGARPAFALIRFGRGMALGQIEGGDTKLERGDYIWFDIGCTYRGYRSDIGRVVAVGEPSSRLAALYSASKQGQERAFELMRPGVEARAVFAAGVERVREAGIAHYERHHIGHGIGVEFYDLPVLAPSSETELEEGMVFEVETPYYELGFGGTFIEDTVIVRRDGPEIVTRLDRELRVLDPS